MQSNINSSILLNNIFNIRIVGTAAAPITIVKNNYTPYTHINREQNKFVTLIGG